MSQKKSPSPPTLPPDAQREILDRLSAETRINSQEIAAILKRHGVCGDMDTLQDAYRKRLGQRLMSTIRDEAGKREVLAASGGEYVIVDCCNNPQKLKAIQRRIQQRRQQHQPKKGAEVPVFLQADRQQGLQEKAAVNRGKQACRQRGRKTGEHHLQPLPQQPRGAQPAAHIPGNQRIYVYRAVGECVQQPQGRITVQVKNRKVH